MPYTGHNCINGFMGFEPTTTLFRLCILSDSTAVARFAKQRRRTMIERVFQVTVALMRNHIGWSASILEINIHRFAKPHAIAITEKLAKEALIQERPDIALKAIAKLLSIIELDQPFYEFVILILRRLGEEDKVLESESVKGGRSSGVLLDLVEARIANLQGS
jgi:hypothetical protein